MSSVSRGRPGTEAATLPMIAPGTAEESSDSDTAPSARTSVASEACIPGGRLRLKPADRAASSTARSVSPVRCLEGEAEKAPRRGQAARARSASPPPPARQRSSTDAFSASASSTARALTCP